MTDLVCVGKANRRRGMIGMFLAAAAMSTSMAGVNTAGSLVAAETVGVGWSGTASACGILGTAFGSLVISRVMARRGSRAGLLIAFAVSSVAAAVATVGAARGAFGVLLIGMLGIGIGNSGGQLARYAAADLYDRAVRGRALSGVVWAGTIGVVLGRSGVAPAAALARALGLPALSGEFVVVIVLTALAGIASRLLPRRAPVQGPGQGPSGRELARKVFGRPVVRRAAVAMMAGQVAMVAVMTMTTVHLHVRGMTLQTGGLVLSAHMVGMFGLAPVSGRLADRFGGDRAIAGGGGLLALACALVAVMPLSVAGLAVALFLVGYGWNLCFVGGSSLLSRHVGDGRTRVQGIVDGMVAGAAVVASLAAGGLLAWAGYAALALAAGGVALVPAAFALRRARA